MNAYFYNLGYSEQSAAHYPILLHEVNVTIVDILISALFYTQTNTIHHLLKVTLN